MTERTPHSRLASPSTCRLQIGAAEPYARKAAKSSRELPDVYTLRPRDATRAEGVPGAQAGQGMKCDRAPAVQRGG
jgi:hypothetical protein